MKMDMKRDSSASQKAHLSPPKNAHANDIGVSLARNYNLLQTAHQTIGNRGVQRMIEQNQSSEREGSEITAANEPIVQRLLETNSFKSQTAIDYKRRSIIKKVDIALTNYHKLGVNDFAERSAQLDVIVTECDTYLEHPEAHPKRIPGVEELKRQTILEKGVIELLAQAEDAAGPAKFYKLSKAQDAFLLAKDRVPGLNRIHISSKLDKCIAELRKIPGAIEEVLKNELRQLAAIFSDDNTPDITKSILREVFENLGELTLNALTPGARFANESEKKRGVREKYVVNHYLEAPGGTSERLGSLVHELTHVSISEQFDNTALFFAFGKNASEDEVMVLVEKRHEDLDKLLAILPSGRFSKAQLDLLNMKLAYPRQGGASGVQRYVSSFFESKKITLADKQRAEYLIDKGMDNTVIEFDTVINQMLIYMQLWKINSDNPFYELLRTVAEEAYDHRMG